MNLLMYHAREKRNPQCNSCEQCDRYYKCDKVVNPPTHTILFNYDDHNKLLYMTYSKPIKNLDRFSKKEGKRIVEEKMNELVKSIGGIERCDNVRDVVNSKVFKTLDYFIIKAVSYYKFKSTDDIFLVYHGDKRSDKVFYTQLIKE